MKKIISNTGSRTVDGLLKDKPSINLDPPYQRKEVWDDKYKRELILSMINALPINAIHLVIEEKENGGESYIVLDGKQRLTAIFGFYNNDFNIPYTFKSLNIEKFYSYKDLEKLAQGSTSQKDEAQKILRHLEKYTITTVEWQPMSYVEQGDIFDRINYSKELSVEERLLAKNFYAKKFVEFSIKEYFPTLAQISKFSEDPRSKDLIWGLRLLYVFFGGSEGTSSDINADINKILTAHYTNNKNGALRIFCEKLHKKIIEYLDKNKATTPENLFDDADLKEMIKSKDFNWENKLKSMSKPLEFIGNNLFSNVKKKTKKNYVPQNKVNAWSLLYFSSFILTKIADKEITMNLLEQNKLSFDQFSNSYLKWVLSDKLRTRRQMEKSSFSAHINELERLYKNLNLQKGNTLPKVKHISDTAADLAMLKSEGKCVDCGSSDVLQKDHTLPISLFGGIKDTENTEMRCEICNRQKQDCILCPIA